MLVSHEDFVGEVKIASIDTLPVLELVNIFIDKYEPVVMADVFGADMYKYLLSINATTQPEIEVKTTTSPNDPGIFYVTSPTIKSNIKQLYNRISVEDLDSDLPAISEPFGSTFPLLSDLLKTSEIDSIGTSEYMLFRSEDSTGPLGDVYVNKEYEVLLSDPASWGGLSPVISFDDLLLLAESKNAKVNAVGFLFTSVPGAQGIRSIKFGDQTFIFSDPEIREGVLKKSKQIISHFVWYWYSRGLHTLTTGSGEVRIVSENSLTADSADKQTKIWNQMSNMIQDVNGVRWWGCRYGSKYGPINMLNY